MGAGVIRVVGVVGVVETVGVGAKGAGALCPIEADHRWDSHSLIIRFVRLFAHMKSSLYIICRVNAVQMR